MNYEQAMEYIHAVQWAGHKPGLTRTRTLLAALGDPHKKLQFVHVAGTNGKGSTAAMLASCLQAAGYRVGLYTSPFINRFNERIQINGQQIPDEALVELVEQVKPAADAMEDVPTEFEIITALGMLYFAQQQCDIVVLEVGLGGTLDSTNVIEACLRGDHGTGHGSRQGAWPHAGGYRRRQGRHHQAGLPGGELRRRTGGRRRAAPGGGTAARSLYRGGLCKAANHRRGFGRSYLQL